ncbi:hypothetical protein BC793_11055 [Actinoplanes xinjiangensis]|uniref:Uncharacterized protein n=1 Tax=Actinoplanes xinjiangensis TaxID=512350 RepID=A0A316FEI8_9ACTN|nr:hypothetical protein BC793_11055 [Actinoplanes xinjiangensis]
MFDGRIFDVGGFGGLAGRVPRGFTGRDLAEAGRLIDEWRATSARPGPEGGAGGTRHARPGAHAPRAWQARLSGTVRSRGGPGAGVPPASGSASPSRSGF